MPVKGDVVIIDDIRYNVIQRDIRIAKSNQQVTLFGKNYTNERRFM